MVPHPNPTLSFMFFRDVMTNSYFFPSNFRLQDFAVCLTNQLSLTKNAVSFFRLVNALASQSKVSTPDDLTRSPHVHRLISVREYFHRVSSRAGQVIIMLVDNRENLVAFEQTVSNI